jgi:hypothetical protein
VFLPQAPVAAQRFARAIVARSASQPGRAIAR